MAKSHRPSPILGASAAMIADASSMLVTEDSNFKHSFELDISRLEPDPDQARRHFDQGKLETLAATMREEGQLQPIVVRPHPENRGHYIITAGERRWRAARLNGWSHIAAVVDTGDYEIVSLIENLQRENLNPVEEARGFRRLIEGRGLMQTQVAERVGRTKSDVNGALSILSLPETFLDDVANGSLDISKNVLVELSRVDRPAVREHLIRLARAGQLTVRAIRDANKPDMEPDPDRGSGGGGRGSISFKRFEEIAHHVRGLKGSLGAIKERDRDRLRGLRDAIDDLLAE